MGEGAKRPDGPEPRQEGGRGARRAGEGAAEGCPKLACHRAIRRGDVRWVQGAGHQVSVQARSR
eukprot:14093717-Alexandrium_andersonii.AAC.1